MHVNVWGMVSGMGCGDVGARLADALCKMQHGLAGDLSKVQGVAVLQLERTNDDAEKGRSLFCLIYHPVGVLPVHATLSSEEFPGEFFAVQSFAVLDVADIRFCHAPCSGIG